MAVRMTVEQIARWPAVRDVVRELGLIPCYVNTLINEHRIDAVRTRLGWLVNPESVARFKAEREARQQRRRSA
ncbi:MAG TPA: hypothetical protein VGS80_20440 [Ktedonobacterales bacterium]|nr:hypothetical protein [Ktedonobacterales bacterium]